MIINIDNKKIRIKECISFKDRLFGLMFKKNFDYGILLDKCNSIHTIFMKECIDVLGLDKDNVIIYYKKNLKPYRFLRIKKAKKIIELPTNFIKDNIKKISIN